MSDIVKRPRIVIEISGGNLHNIAVDGEVEIVTIDYDNIASERDDGELDLAKIEEHLTFEVATGTATEVEAALDTHRDNMLEMAGIDEDKDLEPVASAPKP